MHNIKRHFLICINHFIVQTLVIFTFYSFLANFWVNVIISRLPWRLHKWYMLWRFIKEINFLRIDLNRRPNIHSIKLVCKLQQFKINILIWINIILIEYILILLWIIPFHLNFIAQLLQRLFTLQNLQRIHILISNIIRIRLIIFWILFYHSFIYLLSCCFFVIIQDVLVVSRAPLVLVKYCGDVAGLGLLSTWTSTLTFVL